MKKYTLFLFIFLFVFSLFTFNVNSNIAYGLNCGATDLYNDVTGQACPVITPPIVAECRAGDLFSMATGKPCGTSQDSSSLQQKAVDLIDNFFQRDLSIGSRGNDVEALQQILKSNDFLSGSADGVYGPMTEDAVKEYQKDNGLIETGEIDFSTLEKIKDMPWANLCPFVNVNNNANETDHACPPIVPLPPVKACPTVYSSDGFRQVCPPVTISGVSGPQALGISQNGTWTVSAYDSSGGNLSYSVNWGDQKIPLYSAIGTLRPIQQQDATFTHSYDEEGNYKPVFTVTNSKGRTAQISLSVNIGKVSTEPLVITTISLPNGNVGSNYSADVSASGGTDSYSWRMSSGSLPTGIYLVTASCFASPCQTPVAISGIPTKAGLSEFELTLTSGNYVVSKTFTINIINGGTQDLAISSLSPAFGVVESQVVIHGTGFNTIGCTSYPCINLNSPNIISFGPNVIQSVYSPEGTSLTFTVPSYTTPVCLYSNPPCALAQAQIVPGTYHVSVTNFRGTSNVVNFEVTNFIR
jgi:peptidoglycan hydrolase-like protein with peptidoglycan-binding domain